MCDSLSGRLKASFHVLDDQDKLHGPDYSVSFHIFCVLIYLSAFALLLDLEYPWFSHDTQLTHLSVTTSSQVLLTLLPSFFPRKSSQDPRHCYP